MIEKGTMISAVKMTIPKIFALGAMVIFFSWGGLVLADRSLLLIFDYWRKGTIVAEASFDPGIVPFTIEVRRVPVPATHSDHFIVSLFRGQYVVTSFRYFWPNYTPKMVRINWPCVNRFTVVFDEKHEAICEWEWGREATWTMNVHEDGASPGLSPYFFEPVNPLPEGCGVK